MARIVVCRIAKRKDDALKVELEENDSVRIAVAVGKFDRQLAIVAETT